jgi:hypothetical protein
MAVIENIIVIANLFDTSVVIGGMINGNFSSLISYVTVTYEGALKFKGAVGSIAYGVAKLVIETGGINEVIFTIKFTHTGAFEEAVVFKGCSLCKEVTGTNQFRLCFHCHHITFKLDMPAAVATATLLMLLEHLGHISAGGKSYVEVNSAVVIHEDCGVKHENIVLI